jgi:hypothetical protein
LANSSIFSWFGCFWLKWWMAVFDTIDSNTCPAWFTRNEKVVQKGRGIYNIWFLCVSNAHVGDTQKAPTIPIMIMEQIKNTNRKLIYTYHICINLCKSVIQLPENINRKSQLSRNTNFYIAPKRSLVFFS